MRRTYREVWVAGGLVVFGLAGLIASSQIKGGPAVVDPLGPGRYPEILFGLFTVLSLVHTVVKWREARRVIVTPAADGAADEIDGGAQEEADDEGAEGSSLMRPLATLAAIVVYIPLLAEVGYVIATSLLLIAVHLVFGVRRQWKTAVCVSVVSTVVLYLFFAQLLLVPLPTGALFQ
jgi:hypothetical protein